MEPRINLDLTENSERLVLLLGEDEETIMLKKIDGSIESYKGVMGRDDRKRLIEFDDQNVFYKIVEPE